MNAEDLYNILGVSRNADESEIKKQYRKLCLTHHPDKGGDEEKFKKIQKAYEVLGDDKRRKMYDQMGIVDENESGGMPFGGGGGVDLGSIFANMFGGGFNPFDQAPNMPGRMKRHKPQPKVHEIPVSLYDFYYGKQIKIQFERQKFCLSCKGEGFSSFKTCNSCNGQGFVQTKGLYKRQSSFGVGWRIGLTWDASELLTLGASYATPIKFKKFTKYKIIIKKHR